MKIVNIINSYISKKENIGLGISYIIDELNKQDIDKFGLNNDVYFNKYDVKVNKILECFKVEL